MSIHNSEVISIGKSSSKIQNIGKRFTQTYRSYTFRYPRPLSTALDVDIGLMSPTLLKVEKPQRAILSRAINRG